MLYLRKINKRYEGEESAQTVLNNITINFRKQEFVAILGSKISGKATLINIIGGLEAYTSGDLVIEGISTKAYTEKDWDAYRHQMVGFVFGEDSLIPYMNVAENIELALTGLNLSSTEKQERVDYILEALDLKEYAYSRPSELTREQKYCTTLARAVVKNPKIIIVDEPMGILDRETLEYIGAYLNKLSETRLVIVVSNDIKYAKTYNIRMIEMRGGSIISDSNPYNVEAHKVTHSIDEKLEGIILSRKFFYKMSFRYLASNVGRTLFRLLANSISIISIVLVLALAGSIDTYIKDVQENTILSHPIQIESSAIDNINVEENKPNRVPTMEYTVDGVYGNNYYLRKLAQLSQNLFYNNLSTFMEYIEKPEYKNATQIAEDEVIYDYGLAFGVYGNTTDREWINLNGSEPNRMPEVRKVLDRLPEDISNDILDIINHNNKVFKEIIKGEGSSLISERFKDNYEVISGEWPKRFDEVVLIVGEDNQLETTLLYELGLINASDYKEMLRNIEEKGIFEDYLYKVDYKEIHERPLRLLAASDYYSQKSDGTFSYIGHDSVQLVNRISRGLPLKISAVIRPKESIGGNKLEGKIGYTHALTEYMIDYAKRSDIIKAQQSNPTINVLNGVTFEAKDTETKIKDVRRYIKSLDISSQATFLRGMMMLDENINPMRIKDVSSMKDTELIEYVDSIYNEIPEEVLLHIYNNYVYIGSYEQNLANFGWVDKKSPRSILVYPHTFARKNDIIEQIVNYNNTVVYKNKIRYTDLAASLTKSMGTTTAVISYMFKGFIGIGLVIAMIMSALMLYISIFKRYREVNVLRMLGVSTRRISRLVYTEGLIMGLLSGILGVFVASLLIRPLSQFISTYMIDYYITPYLSYKLIILPICFNVVFILLASIIPAYIGRSKKVRVGQNSDL